jgi:hypothetical protein
MADYWRELVGGALLGTDRRDPPEAPAGALADVVADTVRPTPSGRMLAAVAACTVARRSGVQPQSPAAPLAPPAADDRPVVPPAAARRWRHVVRTWPVLEDEWLRIVDQRGWRLPPDVLVGLLRRHRGDATRRAVVLRMAGPLAPWLLDHLPELAAVGGARRAGPATPAVPPAARPVSPELVPLLDADPAAVVTLVAGGLDSGGFGPPHRAVLINFVAGCRPEALEPLAAALRAVESPAAGIAHLLADLAATRQAMLTELAP